MIYPVAMGLLMVTEKMMECAEMTWIMVSSEFLAGV